MVSSQFGRCDNRSVVDLKRVSSIHGEVNHVSLAVLPKATGISDARIRIWSKKLDSARSKKSFRVFQVDNNTDNRILIPSGCQKQQLNNSQAPLLFRYADGRAGLEIQAAQLTPELMCILALC